VATHTGAGVRSPLAPRTRPPAPPAPRQTSIKTTKAFKKASNFPKRVFALKTA
jgi:hypothetical protein